VPIDLLPVSTISVGAKRILSVDLQNELTSTELLTGVPTITEASGTLVLTNKAVSVAALVINDKSVAIAKAVQCLVDATSAVDGTTYTLLIGVTTTSVPAEELEYQHRVYAT